MIRSAWIGLCLTLSVWAAPLHEAAQTGDVERIRQLVRSDPKTLEERDAKGLTPLILAVQSGHPDCAAILLEMGAKPNTQGWTALHEAAVQGDEASCKVLLQHGADPNRREKQNQGTPLHVAAFQGNPRICQMLIKAGAKVNLRDGEKLTPFFHARDQHHPEALKIIQAAGGRR